MPSSPISYVINGVTAYVQLDGEEYTADQQSVVARRTYIIPYADLATFMEGLHGSYTLTGGYGGTFSRALPYQYPENPRLYVRSATARPMGLDEQASPPTFSYASVATEFRTPDFNYQASDDPDFLNGTGEAAVFYSERITFGTQVLTLKKGTYQFQTSGKEFQEAQGKQIPTLEHMITWHQVPYLPLGVIMGLMGKLNDAEFLGYPAGTLMFKPGSASRRAAGAGLQAWEVELRYSHRPEDWNKAIQPDGTWDFLVYKDDTSQMPYEYGDFSQLDWTGS